MFKAGTPNRGWLIRPSTSGTGDGWTMRSSENGADATQRPTLEIVYSVSTPATPYTSWAAARGLGAANNGPNADPDHNGADNLAEFAYNLNPLGADALPLTATGTNGMPVASFVPGVASEGTLEIQFVRRKGPSSAGLTYTVQFSNDLVSWSEGLEPIVTSLGDEWERVRVRDAVSSPEAARFARIGLALRP